MASDKKHRVGYGRPPVHSRFPKGQSGNPSGRAKGSRNFATDLQDILSAPVTVTENGMPTKVSSQRAALMRLLEKALNGEPRALDRFLNLAQEHSAERAAREEERHLTEAEDEILARYTRDLLRKHGVDEAGDASEGGGDGE
jgi:hypothetical protein